MAGCKIVPMALIGCVGARAAHEALLLAVEEAVKEDSAARLETLLADVPSHMTGHELNRKNLLHQAAWLGYPGCVRILLANGAHPDQPHRKNGCTPLHLAHFCTIEDTSPALTIHALLNAGANVNNAGSHKCGKCALEHAIQHQRLDAVRVLISAGASISLQSVLIAIDVANPQIVQLLLLAGGQCGRTVVAVAYWSQALHRVIYAPLKCPKECYKSMFKLLTQATVCAPTLPDEEDEERGASGEAKGGRRVRLLTHKLMIENELKVIARDYVELAQYLYATLLRNGLVPADTTRAFVRGLGLAPDWYEEYTASAAPLQDLSIRVLRNRLYTSGNIMYGIRRLTIPSRIADMILMVNPL